MISKMLCVYYFATLKIIPYFSRHRNEKNDEQIKLCIYILNTYQTLYVIEKKTADEETRDPVPDLHVDKNWLSDFDVVTSAFLLHLKKILVLLFFFRYDHIAHNFEIAVDVKDLNNKITSRSTNVTGRTGNCQRKAQKDSQRSKRATWNSCGKDSNLHDSLCLYGPFTSHCSYC